MAQFTFDYTATTTTTVKRLLANAGVSHRLFKRLIDQRLVTIAGRSVQNIELHPGQTVTFTLPEDAGVTPAFGAFEVAFENANWLVVNKPAGLSSVPGPATPNDSLLNRAAGYLIKQGYANAQPAIITRLDRDTTGLVLIAKHPFAQGRLDQMGRAGQPEKHYFALVTGRMPESGGYISAPLGPAADGIHQMVRADGKMARTVYRVVTRQANTTLLELHLLTGRTHQIRVHMAQVGHPLFGDELYGGPATQLPAQALIAAKLEFKDPFTDEIIKVALDYPAKWVCIN